MQYCLLQIFNSIQGRQLGIVIVFGKTNEFQVTTGAKVQQHLILTIQLECVDYEIFVIVCYYADATKKNILKNGQHDEIKISNQKRLLTLYIQVSNSGKVR